jgi:glycosyltransferase involved in cell wall biosynthesis
MAANRSPARLTVAMTHPVQYYSPWFRYIASNCPDMDLTVVYATVPTPEQQGVGFGTSFEWDNAPLEGYEFVKVRDPRPGDYLHSDRFFGLDVPEISRAVESSAPDVVLVPGWYSVTLARVLTTCRLRGVPTIYRGDSHLGSSAREKSAGWAIKTRALLRFFNAYLSVGTMNRAYLRHFGIPDSRIFFAPHCVDNALFGGDAGSASSAMRAASLRTSLGIPESDFVILFVGKLDLQKRASDLIAAAARLGAGVTTVIVGTGEEEAHCRADAARLGTSVVFAGFVNQMALGDYYRAAQVCVLPSTGETWGLVVNESLAAGTPCVVSDGVGCAPDLVISGVTGETFAVGDIAACATALARVRSAMAKGHDFSDDCRRTVSLYSFETATEGLSQAIRSVRRAASLV